MGKFSSRYGTDKDLEENGVEVDFGDGIKVTVRRATCKKAKALRDKLEKPHAKAIRLGNLSEEVQENITKRVFTEALIVSWEGVEFLDGTPAGEYSADKGMRILTEFPDFMGDIITAVVERATFQREEQEINVKNS